MILLGKLGLLCGLVLSTVRLVVGVDSPEVPDVPELIVGRASGHPGDQVEVTLQGGVSSEVSGFVVAVGHDPGRLRFLGAVPGDFLVSHAGEQLFFQVHDASDEGYAVVGAIFDFSFPLTVPGATIEPGTVLARLGYEILSDALAGEIPLLNRARTYGARNPVSNVYSGRPGQAPGEPRLVDGSVTVWGAADATHFRRGDANGDGELDLSDAVFVLGYLFLGKETPTCLDTADSNDDGDLDLSDPIFTLSYLFLGEEAPSAPFAACGTDPTGDALSCETHEICGGGS